MYKILLLEAEQQQLKVA